VDSLLSLSCQVEQWKDVSRDARRTGDEPLMLNLCMDDGTYVKGLDFTTFAHWDNMQTILNDLEKDGMVVEELWDVHEDMRVGSGDWDARVRPGLEIDAMCVRSAWEDDSSCSSGDCEEGGVELELRHGEQPRRKHWWFERWRRRVERESLMSGEAVQEPSRLMVLLGTILMVLVFGTVLVLCVI